MVRTSGDVMTVFLPIPLLVSGVVAGIVLSLIGIRRGNGRLTAWGETITGVTLMVAGLVLFAIVGSTGSEFQPSRPVELITCLLLFFLGCLLAALGISTLVRKSGMTSAEQ